MIACYATLLPLGKWHPDEFFQIHFIQAEGWRAVASRIFGWSPRPVSELVIWAYADLVTWTGRPHSVPFLAGMWAVLLLGLYAAARRTRRHPALVAISLVAAFLLLDKPGEMFYWPAAAAAYVLGVGALGMACLLASERQPRTWLLGAALVVAAWCSEIGAMTVLFDAGLLLLAHLLAPRRSRMHWWIWSLVLAAGLFVAVITAQHRGVASGELLAPGASPAGSLRLSVEAAFPDEIYELITVRLGTWVWGIPAALAVKLLLFLGFRPTAAEGPATPDARIRPVLLGVALLLGGFGSLVLGYDKFGSRCCERQETVRATLTVLALYSFAQGWPTKHPFPSRSLLLAVPLLAVFCWRVPDLVHDLRLVGPTIADRASLWRSGRSPGPAIIWRNSPVPRIADGAWGLDPGTYLRTTSADAGPLDWRYFAVMVFFGKHVLTVLPH